MQEQNEGYQLSDQATQNFLWFVMRVFSTSIVVFLRRDFGEQFLGPAAVAVLLAVPAWVCVFPNNAPDPMLWFLAAYFLMVLVARASTLRRWWQGIPSHSHYNGTPRLCAVLPRVPESCIKRWIEPPLTMLLGLALQLDFPPLSAWLFWGGACLFIEEATYGFWQYRTEQRRTDLLIENGLQTAARRSPFLK
jgi:hypothetical protein